MDLIKEKVRKLEDRSIETVQSEHQEKQLII
jgi:hypothetical protein